MPTLSQLEKRIVVENRSLDGITDKLVRRLERYQSEYERLLLSANFSLKPNGDIKRTLQNFNKAQSLNPTLQLGLPGIGKDYVQQYPGISKKHLKFNASIGLESLKFNDVTLVKAYQNVDLGTLLRSGDELDALVKQQLVNIIALESPYLQAVDDLAANLLGAGPELGRLARFADAQLRTTLFGLTRTIDKAIYDDIGEKDFLYAGAGPDKRIRPFCRARLGKEFTRDQIAKFPKLNGSGLPPFAAPGGFRCRHRLVGTSLL